LSTRSASQNFFKWKSHLKAKTSDAGENFLEYGRFKVGNAQKIAIFVDKMLNFDFFGEKFQK
jgi:hypothetical protein